VWTLAPAMTQCSATFSPQAIAGRTRDQVYRDIRAGLFPAPLKRGTQSIWVASEVQAVIEREIRELPRMRTQGARAA
jgi:predicted DNA-binding transcriptional regulator AlpA